MSVTLLGVDDSATMRKVLEISFAGEGYKVITADSANAAVGKLAEKPSVVVLDVSLPDQNGYEACKTIKSKSPGVIVLLMSSKQVPFDAGKGSASGADDHIDKPFDTQSLIDRVNKLLAAKPAQQPVAQPPQPVAPPTPVAVATPKPQPVPPAPQPAKPVTPTPAVQPTPATPRPVPGGVATPAPTPVRVATTQAFEEKAVPAPAPTPARPVASPQPPVAAAKPATPPVAAPAPTPVAAAISGEMSAKLATLGLSPEQVEAVLALSREVVERVVWEVVPPLAEALIKEEIKRLTNEG